MNDPIHCTGNELRSVLESLEKLGMFPWSLDTGVGGNAGYSVSYFKAFPNQPQDASSGTMQSEPDLARTVKGVRKVAGHNAQRNAAAGGGTRAEKPSIVPDEPASISGIRRPRSNATQTSTRPVSEEACKQRTPRWGLKRADGLTQVSTEADIAEPSGTGWAQPADASLSIEDRMAALKARLDASGRLIRSRYSTPAEHARLPHPDD